MPHDAFAAAQRLRVRHAKRALDPARRLRAADTTLQALVRRLGRVAHTSPAATMRVHPVPYLARVPSVDRPTGSCGIDVPATRVVVGSRRGVALEGMDAPLFVWNAAKTRWEVNTEVATQLADLLDLPALRSYYHEQSDLAAEAWVRTHTARYGEAPPSVTGYLRDALVANVPEETRQCPQWMWPTSDWTHGATRLPRLYDVRLPYHAALDDLRRAGVNPDAVWLRPVITATYHVPRTYHRSAWAVYRSSDALLIGIIAHQVGWGYHARNTYQPVVINDPGTPRYREDIGYRADPHRYEWIRCAITGEDIETYDYDTREFVRHPLPCDGNDLLQGVRYAPPTATTLEPTDVVGDFPVHALRPVLRPSEWYDATRNVLWRADDFAAAHAAAFREDVEWHQRRTDPALLADGAPTSPTERWKIWVHLLTEYEREHGHCFPELGALYRGVNLYRWVKNTVQRYRAGELPAPRVADLEAIASWAARVANTPPDAVLARKEAKWATRYAEAAERGTALEDSRGRGVPRASARGRRRSS